MYVKFLCNVVLPKKLLKSANVSQSHTKNKSGFTLSGPSCTYSTPARRWRTRSAHWSCPNSRLASSLWTSSLVPRRSLSLQACNETNTKHRCDTTIMIQFTRLVYSRVFAYSFWSQTRLECQDYHHRHHEHARTGARGRLHELFPSWCTTCSYRTEWK